MKIFKGKVIGVSPKTAKVMVERFVAHPIYLKRTKRQKTYLVEDEIGVKPGDIVKFVTTKPYSKLKKWRVIK